MKKRKRRLFSFSLIELLIVVMIIAILAGLLLPVLNKARESARSSACINNLKTAGISHLFYADTYDGYYLQAGPNSTGTSTNTWSNYFCGGSPLMNALLPVKEIEKSGKKYKFSQSLYCPSQWNLFSAAKEANQLGSLTYGFVGWNMEGGIQNRLGNFVVVTGRYKLVFGPKVKYPVETLLVSDSIRTDAGTVYPRLGAAEIYLKNSGTSTIGFLHSMRANICYFDGHVAAASPAAMAASRNEMKYYAYADGACMSF